MAETTESSKETPDTPAAMTDREFEVNTEVLANGMDDETTLDEEETLEEGEGFNADELDDLHKDAEVPLADLLALYYNPAEQHDQADEDDDHSENGAHVPLDLIQPEPLPPLLGDYEHEAIENGLDNASLDHSPLTHNSMEAQDSLEAQDTVIPPQNQRITRGLAAAYQYFPDSDSSSSDEDYAPAEDWKKEIHIGPEHQAVVPEGLSPTYDQENEHTSKCLWSPKGILEHDLQRYMNTICGPTSWDGDTSSISMAGNGDDEQALYVLFQCDYNCEEAIKKFKSQPPPSEEMTFWSEEECRNFELGLRTCGKDFFSIQQTKIPGRTVGDIVQFYYLWKKTERHDAFSFQLRPNKKKYSFHPGITDYMDRFLDENESAASSRASSPHSSLLRASHAPLPATDDVNHVMTIDKPLVSSITVVAAAPTVASTSPLSGGVRVPPQAYVPTPVIVVNDKEPPAKKPNLGHPVPHHYIATNGPPPLRQMSSTHGNHGNHDPTARLHTAGAGTMHLPNQLAAIHHHHHHHHHHSVPMTSTSNNLGNYLPLNNRPHHPHLNIHAMDSSGSSYAQLTQNS